MKALILGAGRIGRGFVTGLLWKNKVDITFFEYNDALVKSMNERKSYTIHVLGDESKNTVVHGYQAYSIAEQEALVREWESADFIFTAVGGKNLTTVAKLLADAFQASAKPEGMYYKNIVTCENWIEPASKLQAAILDALPEGSREAFVKHIGVSESVVMATGAAAPPNTDLKNPVDTWVQDFWYLPVDRERILGEVPAWQYFDFIDGFADLLQQKIYTNNTSVALIAYLGYLKGHVYVADAANDPEIVPILEEAYREINAALIHGLGVTEESQLKFSKRAKEKYQDRNIIDVVVRIARDPIRKLKPSDRLIGPAQLALKTGTTPKAIALAIAAALYFDYEEDEDAVNLTNMRKEHGVEKVLQDICEISKEDVLYKLILDSRQILKDKGWLKGE